MRGKKLSRAFYARPTLKVARSLLGKYLVRKTGNKVLSGKIIETEAYIGPQDRASHAYGGKKTKRNEAEYLAGGYVYIYLVYGMYWQFNISTYKVGTPECVLIRALDPEAASGPGKLCRYLKLDKSFYGEDLAKSKKLWLEDRPACNASPAAMTAIRLSGWRSDAGRGVRIKKPKIMATKRIGIDYAGVYWANKKWRFVLK